MQKTKAETLAQANSLCKNTLMETLNIEIIDCGDDFVMAKMPVNSRVHQPEGVLHGGATAALAESVGSFAAHLFIDTGTYFVRGVEMTINHLKSVKDGTIFAKATFIHKGRTTQLLEIKITDDQENAIAVCKLLTITLPR